MPNTGERPRTGAGRALMAERERPGPVHKTGTPIERTLCPPEKPQHSKPLAPLGGLAQNIVMGDEGSLRKRWSEEETVLALYLYFQLPFGKLHSGNPEIHQLAAALGRSSSSVAMKLCNFASLDPKITESGRKGLAGASQLDRTTYAEFGQDWTGLVARAESLWAAQVERGEPAPASTRLMDKASEFRFEPYQGVSTTQALVNQRRRLCQIFARGRAWVQTMRRQ